MRTTLAIDDDVLSAARHIADAQRKTIGEVISELARQALVRPPGKQETRNGVLLLPKTPGAMPVTLEMVKQIDEETP